MKRISFLILAVLLLPFSCKKEKEKYANQNLIHTIYELSYNKTSDISTARAAFKLGGTSGTMVQVNEPGIIQFNNDDMPFSTVTRSHSIAYNGFINSGFFFYKDYDDNYYNNTLPIMDTIGFPIIDTISLASIYTLIWTGEGVGTDQIVTLTIDGIEPGVKEITNDEFGSNKIDIPQSTFQDAGLGDCTLTLERSYRKNAVNQGTPSGGRMAYYYSIDKSVFITN